MNQRFTKISRLLNSKDYEPVFKKPDYRVSNRYFLILIKKNTLHSARLGIVVAKKNVSKANQRNRTKRIVRESFRTDEINLATIDLVVLAKRNIDSLENTEISQLLCTLYKEIELKLSN